MSWFGILQTDGVRIRRGTYSCFTFKNTLEILLKGEVHITDPNSNFVSLHLSRECKGLDTRLYIEVVDDIGEKQMYLLSENLVVEKSFENLGIKNPLRRVWFLPWFPVCYCIQY